MIVYRIECKKNKTGPYLRQHHMTEDQDSLCTKLSNKHNNTNDHPVVIWDLYEKLNRKFKIRPTNYRYGFISLKLLYKWFEDCLCDLIDCGYHIATYNIDPYYVEEFNYQCVFDYEETSLIKYIGIE